MPETVTSTTSTLGQPQHTGHAAAATQGAHCLMASAWHTGDVPAGNRPTRCSTTPTPCALEQRASEARHCSCGCSRHDSYTRVKPLVNPQSNCQSHPGFAASRGRSQIGSGLPPVQSYIGFPGFQSVGDNFSRLPSSSKHSFFCSWMTPRIALT